MLLLGSLAFLLLTPRKGNRSWWLVAPYLLASIPSAVLVGKVGSDVNYLWSYRRRSASRGIYRLAAQAAAVRIALIALLAVQVLALAQSSRVPSGCRTTLSSSGSRSRNYPVWWRGRTDPCSQTTTWDSCPRGAENLLPAFRDDPTHP